MSGLVGERVSDKMNIGSTLLEIYTTQDIHLLSLIDLRHMPKTHFSYRNVLNKTLIEVLIGRKFDEKV